MEGLNVRTRRSPQSSDLFAKNLSRTEKNIVYNINNRNLFREKSVRMSSRCKRSSILNFSNFSSKSVRFFVGRKSIQSDLPRQNANRYLHCAPKDFLHIISLLKSQPLTSFMTKGLRETPRGSHLRNYDAMLVTKTIKHDVA